MAVPLAAVALAVFLQLLWGGVAVATKFTLIAFPPLWAACLRFLLGAACLLVFARLNHISLRLASGELRGLLLLALLFYVQIALMNLGLDFTTGAMGAIMLGTNPLFAALFAHLLVPGDRLTPLRSAGMAVAFAGVVLVFWRDLHVTAATGQVLGNVLALSSACLLGWRLVWTATMVRRIGQTKVVVWQMLLAIPLFAASGALFERIRWEALGWESIAGLLYSGLVIAGFAFMAMAYLLQRYRPGVVLSFNFISPIAGVFLAALLLAESIYWNVFAGMVAVGLGLFLTTRGRREAPAATAPAANAPAEETPSAHPAPGGPGRA